MKTLLAVLFVLFPAVSWAGSPTLGNAAFNSVTLTTPLAPSSGGLGATGLTGYPYLNGNSAATASVNIPASAITGLSGVYAPLASPTFTGTVGLPSLVLNSTGTYPSQMYQKPAIPWPVITFQPTASDPTGSPIAVDLFPYGATQPTDNGYSGVAWYDTCNTDITNITNNTNCAHIGVLAEGDTVVASEYYGTASPSNLWLSTNLNQAINEGAYLTPDGTLYEKGAQVPTINNNLGAAAAVEDKSTNLVINSQMSLTYWTASNATVAAASSSIESPDGGTNGVLATDTASAGNIYQLFSIPADTSFYTFSVYVYAGSSASSVQLNEQFYTGGTTVDAAIAIVPSTGALTASGIPTTCGVVGINKCYGAQRITVGCNSGCVSTPQTWWRIWMTVQNASDTQAYMLVYPGGYTGSSSSVLYGAQMEHSASLHSLVPTVSAAVTKPIGTVLVPLNASTINETQYTPASSSAACNVGQRAADANYIYECTAANTWKRAALSSF